jgi:aminoglycoside phosphotransferase (APT) family kinase protein
VIRNDVIALSVSKTERSHKATVQESCRFVIGDEMSCLPGYDSVAMARLSRHHDPVDTILSHHGLHGPWQELPATGIANRIYATDDLVLRVAVEGSEALNDARTESVAAPAARAAGVLVPWLIAFDESGTIVDRPYSLWERVRGETLGLFAPEPHSCPTTWQAVGRQLALLHNRVHDCPDPHGWLDRPERELHLDERIAALAATSAVDPALARQLERAAKELRASVDGPFPLRFLHNDVHAMNVMCARDGILLALIDWGDAGWGDPALELAQVPLDAVPFVLQGYELEAHLDDAAEDRMLWDKLCKAVEHLEKGDVQGRSLGDLFVYTSRIV